MGVKHNAEAHRKFADSAQIRGRTFANVTTFHRFSQHATVVSTDLPCPCAEGWGYYD